jgi:hypothetical protein
MNMVVDNEKREFKRKPCDDLWIVVVTDQNTETSSSVKTKVDNLSDGGVCLVSDFVFELGQTIRFPKSMPSFRGVVVWTCQSKLECKAGVKFTPDS